MTKSFPIEDLVVWSVGHLVFDNYIKHRTTDIRHLTSCEGTAGMISSWNFFLFMVVATVHFLQFFLRKMYFLTLPAGLMFEKQKTDGPLTRVKDSE